MRKIRISASENRLQNDYLIGSLLEGPKSHHREPFFPIEGHGLDAFVADADPFVRVLDRDVERKVEKGFAVSTDEPKEAAVTEIWTSLGKPKIMRKMTRTRERIMLPKTSWRSVQRDLCLRGGCSVGGTTSFVY
ncbi:hypothetical protein TIFTF001_008705 [Ficus carica]|uniref:Uncharacterized protein n=1 Tax=Ficus carica TaxID=3494 RepID=A0AA87ZSZ3_FICCA|nr:hypothetical protein TIFTF001_008705 [Ficus carica]